MYKDLKKIIVLQNLKKFKKNWNYYFFLKILVSYELKLMTDFITLTKTLINIFLSHVLANIWAGWHIFPWGWLTLFLLCKKNTIYLH